MRDIACVVHCHSLHSDGTGTVEEIAAAAARAGADAVLLTDHDTLAARDRGEDGTSHGVLVIVGHEVTPARGDHLLAFGLDEVVDHDGLDARGIAAAVRERGGLGIAAHPWSTGNPRIPRTGRGMPWSELDCVDGLELWSIVTDSVEQGRGWPDVLRFTAAPDRWLLHPPRGRLAAYDALTARGRVIAIGGLDAHQVGIRIGNRVPLRLLGYERSFRLLRTRVLLEPHAPLTEASVLDGLRAGRCYLARDSLAAAAGFAFEALDERGNVGARLGDELPLSPSMTLRARLPRAARLILRRDGEPVASAWTTELVHRPDRPGAHRVEALLPHGGRVRTWIVSNPIYLR